MRLSEIQSKDVIDVKDGKKIGNIIDIKIEEVSGKMNGLILEERKSLFRNNDEYEIKWNQIVKIGEDVILVNLELN